MSIRPLLFIVLLLDSALLSAASLRISELKDIDLGDVPPTARGVRRQSSFCVSMDPPGPFQLIGVGMTGSGLFELTETSAGTSQAIPFRVFVSNRARSRGREMQAGIAVGGLRAQRPRRDGECRRARNFITVRIDPGALNRVPAGQYRGGLILTVAPE